MKKFVFAAALAALVSAPALAQEAKKETAPATAAATVEMKKLELNNGLWVQGKDWNVGTEVKVSKDGKEWAAAPDGVHTSKDGKTVVTTKGGKIEKVETK